MNQFIIETKSRIKQNKSNKSRYKLKTVLTKCGYSRRSEKFVREFNELLNENGMVVEPKLTTNIPNSINDWVCFKFDKPIKNIKPFIERIPVGIYSFKILLPSNDENAEPIERNCDIMVYDTYRQAYEDFINDLDLIFKEKRLGDKEFLEDHELDYLLEEAKREYFEGYDTTVGYRDEDIKDILIYFAQTSFKPVFLPFKDRGKYDISKIARYIYEKDMRRSEEDQYLDKLWNDEKSFLKIFFGGNKRYFIDQINNELFKMREGIPTEHKTDPTVIEEKIDMKRLTLWEIKKIDIIYWRELTNSVYNKYRDEEGYYFSAQSGKKDKRREAFHIDHIKPMACGGLTELSNLQLLTRGENWKKGAKCEECQERHKCTIGEIEDGEETIKKMI